MQNAKGKNMRPSTPAQRRARVMMVVEPTPVIADGVMATREEKRTHRTKRNAGDIVEAAAVGGALLGFVGTFLWLLITGGPS